MIKNTGQHSKCKISMWVSECVCACACAWKIYGTGLTWIVFDNGAAGCSGGHLQGLEAGRKGPRTLATSSPHGAWNPGSPPQEQLCAHPEQKKALGRAPTAMEQRPQGTSYPSMSRVLDPGPENHPVRYRGTNRHPRGLGQRRQSAKAGQCPP